MMNKPAASRTRRLMAPHATVRTHLQAFRPRGRAPSLRRRRDVLQVQACRILIARELAVAEDLEAERRVPAEVVRAGVLIAGQEDARDAELRLSDRVGLREDGLSVERERR